MKANLFLILVLSLANLVFPDDVRQAVAVLDFVAKGMDEMAITALSDRLRTELHQTGTFSVLERGQMDAILKEQGFQQSGACTDQACMVEVGQILGVEKMVAGSLGKLGTLYSVNLRLIDVRSGKIIQTESQDCNCPIEGLFAALHQIAFKLAGVQEVTSVVPAATAAPAPSDAVPGKTAKKESVKEGKGGNGLVIGAVVGGVVVVGGGVAAFMLLKKPAENIPETGSIDFTW
jgi:TolB-like protein